MFYPSLRLEADDLDTLILDVSAGWVPQQFDPGFPVVREVMQNAPDADGAIDTTRYMGARNVTLSMILDASRSGLSLWEMEARLRAFVAPSRRGRIVGRFQPGVSDEVRMVGRGSQFGGVVDALDFRPVTVQWVVPSGLVESAEIESVFAPAGSFDEQAGRTYDLTFDRVYPEAEASSGGGLAVNAGTAAVWPVVTMYGPFTDGVELTNDTTGESLVFTDDLDIAAGDWLRVDFAAKTIVNSTGTSYYDTLDFPSSTWWRLQPGGNRVFMVPGGTYTTPPAGALVEWRSGWN